VQIKERVDSDLDELTFLAGLTARVSENPDYFPANDDLLVVAYLPASSVAAEVPAIYLFLEAGKFGRLTEALQFHFGKKLELLIGADFHGFRDDGLTAPFYPSEPEFLSGVPYVGRSESSLSLSPVQEAGEL
jgi:hypothetical protein